MHSVYRLYNCLCTLHLLVAIVLLSLRLHGSFHYLEIKREPSLLNMFHNMTDNDNNSYHNSELLLQKAELTLAAVYFIASITSSVYSILYLSFYSKETLPNTTSEIRQTNLDLSAPYYYNSSHENDGEEQASSSNSNSMVMLSEMIFWSFLVVSSFTSLASNTLELGTMELLYLRLAIHLFSIYIILLGSHQLMKKQVDMVSSLAFMALVGETFVVISMSGTQVNLVMSYFHRFLDFLLILGHRLDTNPSWEVVLNCRLFYIAITGCLLHADIVLSSSKNSIGE